MGGFMKSQEIKVSIIMPVYNCGTRMVRAIDSVLNQSYKNIQLILIDDGSRDNSPSICDQYARTDYRVEVVHQKNGGASSARNTGLEKVKGDYVAFVDADDEVSELYIEVLLYVATITNTKISTCEAFYCTDNDWKKQIVNGVTPRIINVEDYNFMKEWSHATVWGALFHRSVLMNLKFDTSIFVGEDSLFFANALVKCDAVSYVSNNLYYYFLYDSSLSHGTYDKKRLTEFVAWEKIHDIVAAKSNILDVSSRARKVHHALERYKESLRQDKIDSGILKDLRKIIRENRKFYIGCNPTQKEKVETLIIAKMPFMYEIAYRIYKCIHY